MAGRMGNKRITPETLVVVRVDTSLDLIFVRGAVPGVDDAFVLIRDAKKKMAVAKHNWEKGLEDKVLPKHVVDLPFPAGTKEMAQTMPQIIQGKTKRINNPFTAL